MTLHDRVNKIREQQIRSRIRGLYSYSDASACDDVDDLLTLIDSYREVLIDIERNGCCGTHETQAFTNACKAHALFMEEDSQ